MGFEKSKTMDENTNQNPVPVPPSDEGETSTTNTALPQVESAGSAKEAPVAPAVLAAGVPIVETSVESTEVPAPVEVAPVTPDAIETTSPDKEAPAAEENIHEEELSEEVVPTEKGDDIEEMVSGRKVGAWALFRWFLTFGGILLAIFYVLLLWGLLGGDVSNPLFEALNIQETDLQATLLNLTNYIFGFLAIFFLIGTLIKFFQWLMLGKEAANRGEYGKKSVFFFGIFVVVCILWVGAFWLITNANAKVEHENLDKSIIATVPEKVIGLHAPVLVEFDVGTELFEQIDIDLVRQINWDFESDGIFDATGPKVVHRFTKKGNNNGKYIVLVSVDYYSPSAQIEKTYTAEKQVIIVNEAVQALFSVDKEAGPVPLTVQFNAENSNDPDGEVVLYEWDLDGDGSFELLGGDKIMIEKTYSNVEEVKVTLRVTGTNNDTATITKRIKVEQSAENLQGKIISDKGFTGVPPFEVALSAEQSYTRFGTITSYKWQVEGETEPILGRKLEKTFRTPGEYRVALIIENDIGERDKVEEIIKVMPQLEGSEPKIITKPAAIGGILRGSSPLELELYADVSEIHNPIEWRWDFEGDGIYDNFEEVTNYVYNESGEYDLTLTIVDSFENELTTIQRVIVDRAGVQARINADPGFGTIPLTVAFDGSASTTDSGEIVLYSWKFPDKEPIHSGAKLSYEFDVVGTFPVKLTVTTSNQETSETETVISVRSHPLSANFVVFPNIENPLEIRFDSTASTGTISEYLWSFGDGNVSRKFMPTHTYGFAGDFDVSLKITDSKGVVAYFNDRITVGE